MKRIKILVFPLILFSSFITAQESVPIPEKTVLPTTGICAHRGAMVTHPENTLSAFKEAIRLGAQMIELDVLLTKDNELAVMHDISVDRTTNGTGLVSELTLRELKTLDAGSWKSKYFAGEKIPTLKEVLRIMPNDVWLNIHLKGGTTLGVKTAKLVISENRMHQAVIACKRKAAKGVRQVSKEIYICNMERSSSRAKYIKRTIKKGYPFIQLKKSRNNHTLKEDIALLKQNQIMINYVQVDAHEEVSKLLDLGVNFIFTDFLAEKINAFETYEANGFKKTKK